MHTRGASHMHTHAALPKVAANNTEHRAMEVTGGSYGARLGWNSQCCHCHDFGVTTDGDFTHNELHRKVESFAARPSHTGGTGVQRFAVACTRCQFLPRMRALAACFAVRIHTRAWCDYRTLPIR